MLCMRQLVIAFGKAPSISRNSAETTLCAHHAFLTVASSRWSKSVVDLPGLPPKWVAGKR